MSTDTLLQPTQAVQSKETESTYALTPTPRLFSSAERMLKCIFYNNIKIILQGLFKWTVPLDFYAIFVIM